METISKTINRAKVYNILRQVTPIFYNSVCEKVLSNVVSCEIYKQSIGMTTSYCNRGNNKKLRKIQFD